MYIDTYACMYIHRYVYRCIHTHIYILVQMDFTTFKNRTLKVLLACKTYARVELYYCFLRYPVVKSNEMV